jgi:hypothetical protein
MKPRRLTRHAPSGCPTPRPCWFMIPLRRSCGDASRECRLQQEQDPRSGHCKGLLRSNGRTASFEEGPFSGLRTHWRAELAEAVSSVVGGGNNRSVSHVSQPQDGPEWVKRAGSGTLSRVNSPGPPEPEGCATSGHSRQFSKPDDRVAPVSTLEEVNTVDQERSQCPPEVRPPATTDCCI